MKNGVLHSNTDSNPVTADHLARGRSNLLNGGSMARFSFYKPSCTTRSVVAQKVQSNRDEDKKLKLKLGPGLKKEKDNIVAYKCGVLREKESTKGFGLTVIRKGYLFRNKKKENKKIYLLFKFYLCAEVLVVRENLAEFSAEHLKITIMTRMTL